MRRRKIISITGYIAFFALAAAIITVGVMTYVWVWDASGSIAVTSGVMMGVIFLLALVCTLIDYLRRRYTIERPLKSIVDGVQRMAGGDFSVKLQPRHTYARYDELDIIMVSVNTLAAELSKVEVFRNDFIANVSHEIKTPLSIIQNYATALQGNLSEGERSEYTSTLIAATKRLTDLVTNILKLNKLENQEIVPHYSTVNAGELLRERLLELEEVFERSNLELDCDIDDTDIATDSSLLEIVWNNLLSNAVKFTPAGGSIFVSLKDGDDGVVLTVRDTGCGMDAKTGERIFDKFYQGDTSHAAEGNGLGLALVKKVVDIIGGEISVKSKPGAGSTFTVKLRK